MGICYRRSSGIGSCQRIVRQVSHGSDIRWMQSADVKISSDKCTAGCAERPANGTGLKTVREPGTDVIGFHQRKNLCFILQSAESSGKNDAVKILLKGGAFRRKFSLGIRITDPLRRKKIFPFHHNKEQTSCLVGCNYFKQRV